MTPKTRWRIGHYAGPVLIVVFGIVVTISSLAAGSSVWWVWLSYTLAGVAGVSTVRSAEALYRTGYFRGRVDQLRDIEHHRRTGQLPIRDERAGDPWAPWSHESRRSR